MDHAIIIVMQRDYLVKYSIACLLETFFPIIRRKKDRPIRRRKKWVSLLELLSSGLPLIASDFVIHETTGGIRLALKRSLTEPRRQRHVCLSSMLLFFPPSLALSFHFGHVRRFSRGDVMHYSRGGPSRKRRGLRDSAGTGVSISIGTIFWTPTLIKSNDEDRTLSFVT